MHPEIAKLGPLTIHSWGFMVALAFLVGILLSARHAQKASLPRETIFDLGFYVLIASMLGARIVYVIQFWRDFKEHPMEIFMIQNGGVVFFGGFFAALLTFLIYTRLKKIPLLKLLDLITPPTALGYAIGRIGCFLNGCCYGKPTDLPWGVSFQPGSEAYWHFGATHLHPTQLYASATLFFIFLLLLFLSKKVKRDGDLFAWGLMCYAIYRFFIEFIRANPTYWFGLSLSQYAALSLLIPSLYLLVIKPRLLFRKTRREPRNG